MAIYGKQMTHFHTRVLQQQKYYRWVPILAVNIKGTVLALCHFQDLKKGTRLPIKKNNNNK